MKRERETSEARQRILETADRLFYKEGIRAVGIDRVIAEAGVAKMTLYAHFPSKDELVMAVLKHREATFGLWFKDAMERHGARTKDPLRAFFGALKEWFESPDFRGCVFINTSVEITDCDHPSSEFVRRHKLQFAEFIKGLVEQALGKSAAKMAPAVNLLVEGAIVTAVIQRSSEPADVARDATLKLIRDAKGI